MSQKQTGDRSIKAKMTTYIEFDMVEQMRAIAVYQSMEGNRITLTEFINESLKRELERWRQMELEYTDTKTGQRRTKKAGEHYPPIRSFAEREAELRARVLRRDSPLVADWLLRGDDHVE